MPDRMNMTGRFKAVKKAHPAIVWVPVLVGVLTLLLAMKTGAQLALDQRYVTQSGLAAGFENQRKLFLEDKIFEIRSIPEIDRTPVQIALLERYEDERDDIALKQAQVK